MDNMDLVYLTDYLIIVCLSDLKLSRGQKLLSVCSPVQPRRQHIVITQYVLNERMFSLLGSMSLMSP